MRFKFLIRKNYKWLLLLFIVKQKNSCLSDWQHHNSFLIGERAAGMGGAYTALANDPSGIFYNPGGTAFSQDKEINLSTAGYYVEKLEINSYAGISDYQYQYINSDIINGFLGFVSKIKIFEEDYFLTFAIYTADHTNVNNKVYFTNPSRLENIPIQNLSNNFRITGDQSNYEIALAKRIDDNLGIGAAIGFFNIQQDELGTIDIFAGPYPNNGIYKRTIRIYDSSLNIRGMSLNIGSRYIAHENFSIGFNSRFQFPILEKFSEHGNGSLIHVDSNGIPLSNYSSNEQFTGKLFSFEKENFIPILPIRISLGIAYNYLDKLILSADLNYYTGINSEIEFYKLKSIINYAFGSEFKLFDSFIFRFGYFTNKNADSGKRQYSVTDTDFIGISGGIAYKNSNNSSYSLTIIYQSTDSAKYILPSTTTPASWDSTAFLLGINTIL